MIKLSEKMCNSNFEKSFTVRHSLQESKVMILLLSEQGIISSEVFFKIKLLFFWILRSYKYIF